jgi:hypothetical protein
MHVDALAVVINAIVVAGVGLALWWAFRGRFEALESRMDRLEGSVHRLRSDLTAVALAVGARPQAGDR